MAVCSLLIASGALVGWVEDDRLAIVLLGVMALGTAAFMANYFAFCQEVSTRNTGFVVGVLGGLGNLLRGGFLAVCRLYQGHLGSFAPIFLLAGLLPFIGLGALLFGWGSDLRRTWTNFQVRGGRFVRIGEPGSDCRGGSIDRSASRLPSLIGRPAPWSSRSS